MKPLRLLTPVLFLILLGSNFSYSQSGWQYLNPTPILRDYKNIYMLNDNTGIAVGYPLSVVKTTNAGISWNVKNVSAPAGISLVDFHEENIYFKDDMTGYIGGNYLFKTTNTGESWFVLTENFPQWYNEIKFTDSDHGFLLNGNFYTSTNGGIAWTFRTPPFDYPGNPSKLRSMDFINNNTGFIAVSNGKLLKTIDGGLNWTQVMDTNRANPFMKIKFLDNNNAVMMTLNGKLLKSSDQGLNWNLYGTALSLDSVMFFKPISQNFIWGYGKQNSSYYFFKTTDGGVSWISTLIPDYFFLNKYDVTPNGNMFQSSGQGLIYKSTNFGSAWECLTSELDFIGNFHSVKFLNSNTGFLGGVNSLVFKTTNGGASFSKLNLNLGWDNMVNDFNFLNENTGFLCTKHALYKTTNSGVTWNSVFYNDDFMFDVLQFTNEQNGFAIIYKDFGEAGLYKTTDGGLTWQIKLQRNYLTKISFANSTTGFTADRYSESGPHGGSTYYTKFYKTTDGGDSWFLTLTMPGAFVTALHFFNENTGLAAGDYNEILKTTDGGYNWTTTGFYDRGYKIQFLNSLTGYLGSSKTTDGGNTWFKQNFEGTDFDFVTSEIGYGIGGYGAILKTTDGGGVSVGILNTTTTEAKNYSLSQNYPNPFNPETKIQFSIPKNGFVKIIVYDLLGREVNELVNEFKQQGSYGISFNGANLSSGIYFYKLITDDFIETKKMILIK